MKLINEDVLKKLYDDFSEEEKEDILARVNMIVHFLDKKDELTYEIFANYLFNAISGITEDDLGLSVLDACADLEEE